jgi:hypothetical protein
MSRKAYLVIFVVLLAVAATGVYLRQRAKAVKAATAKCDTPAPPPPQSTPPPKVPGFAIEPACGPGEAAPPAPPSTRK